MKKYIVFMIALLLAAVLTACSSWNVAINDPESSAQSGAQSTSAAESNAQTENPEAEAEASSTDPFADHDGLTKDELDQIAAQQEPASLQGNLAAGGFGRVVRVFGGTDGNVPLTAAFSDDGETWSTRIIKKKTDELCGLSFWSRDGGALVLGENRESSGDMDVNIYTTADGGESWELTAEAGRKSGVTGTYFLSEKVWLMAYNSAITETTPQLYRTADGGESWELCEIPLAGFDLSDKYAAASSIWYEDGKLMTAVQFGAAEFAVFTSEDEGRTWVFDTLNKDGN